MEDSLKFNLIDFYFLFDLSGNSFDCQSENLAPDKKSLFIVV